MNANSEDCYLIAEIGLNHNGNFDLAEKSVRAAAKAGASAVKFQNFKTEDFLTDRTIMHVCRDGDREVTEPLFDICKRSEFQSSWFKPLIKLCDELGVNFMSTPTSIEGIDELLLYGVQTLKNGSDYLCHLEVLTHMARSNANVIISIGMAYEKEIDEAVNAIRAIRPNLDNVCILHCTSNYPAQPDNVNLNKIRALQDRYKVPIGFSDHTVGWEAAVQAVTMGATVIEKHFTLDKKLNGPDHWFSSDPSEFAEMVEKVRLAEVRLGSSKLQPAAGEQSVLQDWKLGLVWNCDKSAGETVTRNDIAIRKPAAGVSPKDLDKVIGAKTFKFCAKGAPVFFDELDN